MYKKAVKIIKKSIFYINKWNFLDGEKWRRWGKTNGWMDVDFSMRKKMLLDVLNQKWNKKYIKIKIKTQKYRNKKIVNSKTFLFLFYFFFETRVRKFSYSKGLLIWSLSRIVSQSGGWFVQLSVSQSNPNHINFNQIKITC